MKLWYVILILSSILQMQGQHLNEEGSGCPLDSVPMSPSLAADYRYIYIYIASLMTYHSQDYTVGYPQSSELFHTWYSMEFMQESKV